MWTNKITLFKDIVKVTLYDVFFISALTLAAMQTLDKLSDSNRKSFTNLDFKNFYPLIFSSRHFRFPGYSLVSFILRMYPSISFPRKF